MFKKIKELLFIKKNIEESKAIEDKIKASINKLNEEMKVLESNLHNKQLLFNGVSDMVKKISNTEITNIIYLNGVTLPLKYMNIQDLEESFKKNNMLIEDTFKKFQTKFTTKSHYSIYVLLSIAIKAELQNILYNLTYSTLEDSVMQAKNTLYKFLNISTKGNQDIASILVSFIGELTPLYIDAIKIEYEYYSKENKPNESYSNLTVQINHEYKEFMEQLSLKLSTKSTISFDPVEIAQ